MAELYRRLEARQAPALMETAPPDPLSRTRLAASVLPDGLVLMVDFELVGDGTEDVEDDRQPARFTGRRAATCRRR